MMFYNNTGLMFELAKEWNALVFFAEHRYYGQTLPFGQNSFTPTNMQWLTSEQALADYAQLLRWFKYESTTAMPYLSIPACQWPTNPTCMAGKPILSTNSLPLLLLEARTEAC